MKICNNCGATLNDNAPACTNCGVAFPTNPPAQNVPAKTPVTIGGWIGRSLIPCIPLVGGIIYLIMLFIWSGDTTKEETFRNWAKAQLIVTAIFVVLGILVSVVFGAVLGEAISSMSGYGY